MVGKFNDDTNFPHILLLTNMQVSKIRKPFTNRLSANIKFSKSHLSKMAKLGGILGRTVGPLLKTGFPLMGNT